MVLGTLNNWGNLNVKDGDLKPLFLGKSVIRSSANSSVETGKYHSIMSLS